MTMTDAGGAGAGEAAGPAAKLPVLIVIASNATAAPRAKVANIQNLVPKPNLKNSDLSNCSLMTGTATSTRTGPNGDFHVMPKPTAKRGAALESTVEL